MYTLEGSLCHSKTNLIMLWKTQSLLTGEMNLKEHFYNIEHTLIFVTQTSFFN